MERRRVLIVGGGRDGLREMWAMRSAAGTLLHFRKPIGVWAREHLESQRLQRMFARMLPETSNT